MKKFALLFLFSFLLTFSFAQNDTVGNIAPLRDSLATDTMSGGSVTGFDYQPTIDTAAMSRNLESFVRMQNENTKKQKRQAMLKIVFGAAMLVVLVIGLMRKKKK